MAIDTFLFGFGHKMPEQRQLLAQTAVDLMFEAVRPLGILLACLPLDPDHPGGAHRNR